MQTRYGGRLALVGLLALSACSSDEPAALTSSPTATATASSTPSPSPSPRPAVTKAPSPTPSPTPSPRRSSTPSPTHSLKPSPSPKPSPTPSPTRKAVTYALSAVTGDLFDPDRLTMRVGDSVRVRNEDTSDHDFAIRALSVSSGNMAPGTTFTYRFRKAGTFDFVCEQHEALDMKGTVTVKP